MEWLHVGILPEFTCISYERESLPNLSKNSRFLFALNEVSALAKTSAFLVLEKDDKLA